jgi:hypothetical protein
LRPDLQEDSDLPEVQAQIRRAVLSGRVRVVPWPGDPTRVRLVTPDGDDSRPDG